MLSRVSPVSRSYRPEPRRDVNLQFNPTRVTDTALRRAVFAAVDRSQLAKVKFGQINWEEPRPAP